MKGFSIRYAGRMINISPKHNGIIMINQKDDQFHMRVYGMEEGARDKAEFSYWLDSTLSIGELIEIEIRDIQQSSAPMIEKMAFSDVVEISDHEYETILNDSMLNYLAIQRILKEEGLIT
ncbi:hypothetical protein [Sphingobacterium griseoflavum]|uniref:Uncharacterized protein n=1 Tax=Sphingobacterium griseoflavum TaxID=1474952 RepID=A0ABQ3I094_9SPHI|nr:hypothetical protein [Sphingobacterium griseoflavum]GHE37034.1 hypothetical protein GCM10017764_20310 [Sphingobacterium griseoflavum]